MAAQPYTLQAFCFDRSSQTYATKSTERTVGVNDVLIRTTHSGLCYTDVHAKDKGCGLGHEGVGFVTEIGEGVRQLKVGDRVGWGWLHASCGLCSTCLTGYRQYCAEARGFAFSDLDQGALGDMRIIDAAFAYRIPEVISSIHAGPLMCAGASVYEALDAAETKASHRVGVVGIGGLGHMGVLMAAAMGCAVTAITTTGSVSKREDAFKLGADEYRSLTHGELSSGRNGPLELEPQNIDIILVTSNTVPDLEQLLPLLARRATIVLMTIQTEPLPVPYMSFVLPGHRLLASTEASRDNHMAMLDFVARKGIQPWVELFPMTIEGIEQAFHRLEAGEMRYRGVLVRPGD